MNNIYLCILLIFSLQVTKISVSVAQTNYKKGYYITNSMDTVHGLIKYGTSDSNKKQFTFKESVDSEEIIFYPGGIFGYVIDDKAIYRSFQYEKSGVLRTEFLLYLVKGEVSLLFGPNPRKKLFPKPNYYIYDERTQELADLDAGREIIKVKGRRYYTADKYARGILNYVMQDYWVGIMKIMENYSNIYTEPALIEIVTTYNAYLESENYVINYPNDPPHFSIDLRAQYSLRKASIAINPTNVLEDDPSASYTVGISTAIFIPRVNETVRILAGLMYNTNSTYIYYRSSDNISNDLYLDYDNIEVSLGIRKMHITPLNLSLEVNGIYTNVISESYSWRRETSTYNSPDIFTEDVTLGRDFFQKPLMGFSTALGKDFKVFNRPFLNVGVEYSYQREIKNTTKLSTLGAYLRINIIK